MMCSFNFCSLDQIHPHPCVCLRFCCVYLVCLQLGQYHSKPRVCHSQCQASQRDPGTQRGLRGPTDPPPALPVSLRSKASRSYRSTDEEAFSSSARSPSLRPTCSRTIIAAPKGPPIVFCMPIDLVGVRGGLPLR